LLIDAAWRLALLGAGLAATTLALMPLSGLGAGLVLGTSAAYGAAAALILLGLRQHAPHRRFGPANSLTAIRADCVALLIGVLVEGGASGSAGRWLLAGVGLAALALDGADGWAARRSGLVSPFGARFDMEVDAARALALAALVWRAGQAGGWVLTSGVMRYIFVLAGWLYPALAAPLAASFRRKAVCVFQTAVLLLALTPAVGPAAATVLCLGGLMLLSYSFGIDALWLLSGHGHRVERVTT
jgi:phosphatidylglycerophosphate synthase